jgi:hypothetical protein
MTKKKTEKKTEAKAVDKEVEAKAEKPLVKKETKAKAPVKEMPKPSARKAVKVAWVKAFGGGHPPVALWESLTTELALGRKTDDEIRAELLKLADA